MVLAQACCSVAKRPGAAGQPFRDARVADFRHRPLDQGPYTFAAADALVLKGP